MDEVWYSDALFLAIWRMFLLSRSVPEIISRPSRSGRVSNYPSSTAGSTVCAIRKLARSNWLPLVESSGLVAAINKRHPPNLSADLLMCPTTSVLKYPI